MTLVEFLTARFAEDHAEARRRAEKRIGRGRPVGEFTATNTIHALRDVEAKRAILAEHADNDPTQHECLVCADAEEMSENSNGDRFWERSGKNMPCPTLRALAAVYRDHPDYDKAWRPKIEHRPEASLLVAPTSFLEQEVRPAPRSVHETAQERFGRLPGR